MRAPHLRDGDLHPLAVVDGAPPLEGQVRKVGHAADFAVLEGGEAVNGGRSQLGEGMNRGGGGVKQLGLRVHVGHGVFLSGGARRGLVVAAAFKKGRGGEGPARRGAAAAACGVARCWVGGCPQLDLAGREGRAGVGEHGRGAEDGEVLVIFWVDKRVGNRVVLHPM